DTGTRTALYRAVRLVSPVSIDTEIYRAVTVEISTVTARHSSVTVDFDRYRPAQLGTGPTGYRYADRPVSVGIIFYFFINKKIFFNARRRHRGSGDVASGATSPVDTSGDVAEGDVVERKKYISLFIYI
ncbi:unnamed protein product, partial [Musa textilis]